MDRRYVVLDVFTAEKLEGNPLAVVLDSDGLDTRRMQAIAREFGLPETVFVAAASRPGLTAKLRIFTPAKELDFAGHPTVGTAVLLASRRFPIIEKTIDSMIVLEENVGPVRCAVKLYPDEAAFAEFDVPRLPETVAVELGSKGAVADALGLVANDIGFENHRPSAYSAGTPFIFVPVNGLAAIGRARPNIALWREAFGSETASVYLYTRECLRHTSRFHARMFGPGMGIPEDPATGSAAAAFAGVIQHCDKPTDGTHHYVIEQGFEMGRPSLINLTLEMVGSKLKTGRVGGNAIVVAEGTLKA
jgi:trans-2,3-dihydro-3-hydroxyanthranilate isomerase